ncbi:m7GpppX diphosphatase-like [Acanthaster planci]|uniref:m7GpppX diphosphatase n=1 Tax=Acanthaster planci TaxID=133434 RepID=A0A8B7YYK3_ACAPL|nr:m7GpppX diphosphatase-like [Acanthaster planci]
MAAHVEEKDVNCKRSKIDDTPDQTSVQSTKKIKKDKVESEDRVSKTLESFDGFEVLKILYKNPQNKSVFLYGKFQGNDDNAVVLLEKTPFPVSALSTLLSADVSLKPLLQNDIYSVYDGLPKQDLGFSGIKTTVIYPATERHIEKYTDQDVALIEETCDDYCNITLPYLEEQTFKIQWVYNILEKKAEEVERIVYEDPDHQDGFVLLPDMKWDRKQMENLYLVAICHRKGIKSLRDLNHQHLPLLRNIRDKCQKEVQEKYCIASDQLRLYLHYQPSYYHLHVHVTHVKFDAPGSGVTRAHLLSDVIENIELMPDYYQRKTLTCVLREKDGLLARFREVRGQKK